MSLFMLNQDSLKISIINIYNCILNNNEIHIHKLFNRKNCVHIHIVDQYSLFIIHVTIHIDIVYSIYIYIYTNDTTSLLRLYILYECPTHAP